jgi:hydrogenase expression/formation protein HypC
MAIPGQVIEIKKDSAVVDFGSVKKDASMELVSVKKGDWVFVFSGHIMEKLSEERAKKILSEFNKGMV